MLVGNSGQHTSIEAGDGARIVEKESRVTVAKLREVRRQSVNAAYRAAAEALAASQTGEALAKLDAMGAIVEVENPTQRRFQMVAEWFAATQETKLTRTKSGEIERAKTALLVAPTWAEIDALNTHAREKLRTAGQITGDEKTFTSLRAKDWTKAQQKDARNYTEGDVRGAEEISVSPRQPGLAWTVCEERPMTVATGGRLRVRAVSHVEDSDGRIRRLANGSAVVVQSVGERGEFILADRATLRTRQVVHGYAMTSHAAQGLTVDKVFVAGAISREGLYVSATRGREAIRVFVPDREAFLASADLRSEARPSAMEFVRQHALGTDLRSVLARGWRQLLHVRAHFAAHPKPQEVMQHEAEEKVTPTIKLTPKPSVSRQPDEDHESRPRPRPARQPAVGMRMRF